MPARLFNRRFGLLAALCAGVVGLFGWQWGEHRRFEAAASQALVNRGRDITSTLGIIVRSQRRFGLLVARERIESTLQALIHPGDLEGLALLGPTGETIASAGRPIDLSPESLRARGVHWRAQELVLLNLMDLGQAGGAGEERPLPAAVVVSGQRMPKAARTPVARPNGEGGTAVAPRFQFGRPAWMDQNEYEALLRTQGVHSLVISLSTAELRRTVRGDFLLRALVSAMGLGVAIVSGLAWRNRSRNDELQVRLLKAGEMNGHLAQMNLAAAGLAHETRNPLNLIRGHAQLVSMDPAADPRWRAHAAAILEEADRVTVQLNQFIDYAKPRQPVIGPVDLAALAADVGRTLGPDLEEKRVALLLPAAPVRVAADEALLRQALFNLVLNAIQAVEPGGRVEVAATSGPGGAVTLEVRDDGRGVAEADREEIFKPYVTQRKDGVGLGLAVVRQIALAHGWEITCGAHQPRGAVFRMAPLRPSSAV
jgi:signal transduction histidine kinase